MTSAVSKLQNPKLFKWLADRSPDDDSNIGVALLLIPSIAVWTTMAVHFGSISNHAIKLQAKMGSEVPGSSTIVAGHAVTISLCLLFLTIGDDSPALHRPLSLNRYISGRARGIQDGAQVVDGGDH